MIIMYNSLATHAMSGLEWIVRYSSLIWCLVGYIASSVTLLYLAMAGRLAILAGSERQAWRGRRGDGGVEKQGWRGRWQEGAAKGRGREAAGERLLARQVWRSTGFERQPVEIDVAKGRKN